MFMENELICDVKELTRYTNESHVRVKEDIGNLHVMWLGDSLNVAVVVLVDECNVTETDDKCKVLELVEKFCTDLDLDDLLTVKNNGNNSKPTETMVKVVKE